MKRILALSISLAVILSFTVLPVSSATGIGLGLENATVSAGSIVELALSVTANPAGIGTISDLAVTLPEEFFWFDEGDPQDVPEGDEHGSVIRGLLSDPSNPASPNPLNGLDYDLHANPDLGTNKTLTMGFSSQNPLAAGATGTLVIYKFIVPAGLSGTFNVIATVDEIESATGGDSYVGPITIGGGLITIDDGGTGGEKPSVASMQTREASGGALTSYTLNKIIPSSSHSVVVYLEGATEFKLENNVGNANNAHNAAGTGALVGFVSYNPSTGIELRSTATVVARDGVGGEELRVTFTRWGDVNGAGSVGSAAVSAVRSYAAGNITNNNANLNLHVLNVSRAASVGSAAVSAIRGYAAGNVASLPVGTANPADAVMEDNAAWAHPWGTWVLN